jgi:hypothetical protein
MKIPFYTFSIFLAFIANIVLKLRSSNKDEQVKSLNACSTMKLRAQQNQTFEPISRNFSAGLNCFPKKHIINTLSIGPNRKCRFLKLNHSFSWDIAWYRLAFSYWRLGTIYASLLQGPGRPTYHSLLINANHSDRIIHEDGTEVV